MSHTLEIARPSPSTVCIPANLQQPACEECSTLHFKTRGTEQKSSYIDFSASTVTLIYIFPAHTALLYFLPLLGLPRDGDDIVIVVLKVKSASCKAGSQFTIFEHVDAVKQHFWVESRFSATHCYFLGVFFCISMTHVRGARITDEGCELLMDMIKTRLYILKAISH